MTRNEKQVKQSTRISHLEKFQFLEKFLSVESSKDSIWPSKDWHMARRMTNWSKDVTFLEGWNSLSKDHLSKDHKFERYLDHSKGLINRRMNPSRDLTSFESQFERYFTAHLSRLRINILRVDFRQHSSSEYFPVGIFKIVLSRFQNIQASTLIRLTTSVSKPTRTLNPTPDTNPYTSTDLNQTPKQDTV